MYQLIDTSCIAHKSGVHVSCRGEMLTKHSHLCFVVLIVILIANDYLIVILSLLFTFTM